jgi:hypothetical protein
MLKLILLLSSISHLSFALEFQVLDPCSGKVVLSEQHGSSNASVGELSERVLTRTFGDFIGSSLGVNTMLGTPIGQEALEIISRREMRSYGWCYAVDGVVPEVYPLNFPLSNVQKSVQWFFGYAFYDSGEWLTQCEPLHVNPHSFICD